MNENRYELFDQYLNNELSLDDKINFENQLKNDIEFSESFEIFKDVNQHLSNKFENQPRLNDFKTNLKQIASENFIKKETKIFSIKPIYYAIAACFALFFGLLIFNKSGVPIYEDFRQFEEAQFIERGDVIKEMKLAQDAFNSKKFNEAATLFEKILKSYQRPEIEYFYAISLLETNKFFEAEIVFNKLKNGKSIFKTKAVWNLALSKLKQKDFESCKQILKTIPNDFEDYDQVEKLLKSLE